MKSAFDLAMERMGGGPIVELDTQRKGQIAEAEAIRNSKKAEAEFAFRARLEKTGGAVDAINHIKEDFSVEMASIESRFEREKEAIRNGSQS